MSLERAYKNCIDCNNLCELYGDNKETHLDMERQINHVLNEAMKALEEEKQHSAAYSSSSYANTYRLAETALAACVKCNRRDAAIADLLEEEMPEIFGENIEEDNP